MNNAVSKTLEHLPTMIALTVTLAVTLLIFTIIWLIHVRLQDAGVIDYYWAPGFFVISVVYAWIYGFNPASLLLCVLVGLWAVRLTSHLVERHLKMASEDGRYAAMRESGGKSFWWKSLFSVFLLQGVLQWLIASPFHVVAKSAEFQVTAPLFVFGFCLYVLGLVLESAADWQLRRFRASRPVRGSVISSGLWGLSRHPNYLGEMILWLGLGVIGYSASGSWLALAGPVLLILVMTFVSIPLTEQHLTRTRPAFAAYAARTPVLIPYLPALNFIQRK